MRVALLLAFLLAGCAGIDAPAFLGGERPRDIRVLYVIPSDGVDRGLVEDGNISRSLAAASAWLSRETDGGRLPFVADANGTILVETVRVRSSEAGLRAKGNNILQAMERDLEAAGVERSGVYAVYYEGGSVACGGSTWPPRYPGHMAALFLRSGGCGSDPVGANGTSMGYREFAILHEILHAIGIVPTCAENFVEDGHVGDDRTDIMYSSRAGGPPYLPGALDPGHDDYYKTGRRDCPDLDTDGWLLR